MWLGSSICGFDFKSSANDTFAFLAISPSVSPERTLCDGKVGFFGRTSGLGVRRVFIQLSQQMNDFHHTLSYAFTIPHRTRFLLVSYPFKKDVNLVTYEAHRHHILAVEVGIYAGR